MQILRKYASNLLVKIILLLVAFSFVIWGINGDSLSLSKSWIVKIGSSEYSIIDWQRMVGNEVQKIRSQNPEFATVDNDETRLAIYELKLGLIKQVVTHLLLLEEAKNLGIVVSDFSIQQKIMSMEIFHDSNKKFDKQKFESLLSTNRVNEAVFINKVRDEIMLDRLLSMFFGNKEVMAPQLANLFIQSMYSHKNFTVYKLFPSNLVVKISAPSDNDLLNFIKDNQSMFQIPETRDISFFILTEKDLDNKDFVVSDEEIEKYYNDRSYNYQEPEKRHIVQIIFQTHIDATKAYNDISNGLSFSLFKGNDGTAKGKEKGAKLHSSKSVDKTNKESKTNQDSKNGDNQAPNSTGYIHTYIDMGNVGRDQFNEKLADMLFSLNSGAITPPISTPLGWHIFKVVDVQPTHLKPLSAVKSKIEYELRRQKISSAMNEAMKSVSHDLEFGSGDDVLDSVAKKYGVKVRSVKNLAVDGRIITGDGANISDAFMKEYSSDAEKIAKTSFDVDKGDFSAPIQTEDGNGFFVLIVDGLHKSFVPDVKVIKQKAVKFWEKSRREELLARVVEYKYRELTKKNQSSEINAETAALDYSPFTEAEVADYAKKLDIKTQNINFDPIKDLDSKNDSVSNGNIVVKFHNVADNLKLNEFSAIVPDDDDGSFVFFKLNQITYLYGKDFTSVYEKYMDKIMYVYRSINVDSYMNALSKKYKISVNENAF